MDQCCLSPFCKLHGSTGCKERQSICDSFLGALISRILESLYLSNFRNLSSRWMLASFFKAYSQSRGFARAALLSRVTASSKRAFTQTSKAPWGPLLSANVTSEYKGLTNRSLNLSTSVVRAFSSSNPGHLLHYIGRQSKLTAAFLSPESATTGCSCRLAHGMMMTEPNICRRQRLLLPLLKAVKRN